MAEKDLSTVALPRTKSKLTSEVMKRFEKEETKKWLGKKELILP
jgi:hypothetical protein